MDSMESGENTSKVRNVGTAMLLTGIIFGAVGGYVGRPIISPERSASSPPSSQTGMMGGPPGMGGGMGGMMGGGGGGQQAPGTQVARLVRNLATIEKVQGVGLSAEQKQGLAPILKSLKEAESLPEKDAQAKLEAIEKTLTEDQKKALESLGARGGGGGGGRGGAPGAGGPPGGAGGPPGMGGGGGGMGGGRPDPNKPFASERNKQALDDLIADVGKGK